MERARRAKQWRYVAGLAVAGALLAHSTEARATSLSVLPDKLVYQVGETITLTVIGDSQGAQNGQIYGLLSYSPFLTQTLASSQTLHTSFSGAVSWISGTLPIGDGFATLFNQLISVNPHPVDQIQIATATLRAEAPGTVAVSWEEIDFFGIGDPSTVAGTSFEIVPEPATGALLASGVATLACRARRGRRF